MAVDEPVSPVERLMKDLYVVAAIGLAAPLNLPVFRAGLEAQLARHPYFRSIQVTGKDGAPRWVTTAVNLDDHIVVPRLLAADGDPDWAVEDYLASLSTLPMYHARPPWDFHFLDVPTAEAAATVALRIHHALADGMALITLLVSSARSAADPARPAPAPPPPPARRAGAIYAPRASGGPGPTCCSRGTPSWTSPPSSPPSCSSEIRTRCSREQQRTTPASRAAACASSTGASALATSSSSRMP